jgi:hypothetical protein
MTNQADQPVMDILKQFFPMPVPALQFVNGVEFQFEAPQGFVYQPQTSPDLSLGSWTSYGPSFVGTGGITNLNIQVGPTPSGFYRVQVSHVP